MNISNETRKLYDEKFYRIQQIGSKTSAKEIVPLVVDLIQPKSVIDVGCGVGTWLSVFMDHGIKDVLGIDGTWVDKKMLLIPENCYLSHDLKRPINISRSFDLVLSLEVAEHLPKEYSRLFIKSLVSLGPLVLFSAAIPSQGGKNHLNEQWQEYWVDLFMKENYAVIDAIRRKVWNNDKVDYYYSQNMLLFSNEAYLEKNISLKKEHENTVLSQINMVHPKLYLAKIVHPKIYKFNSILKELSFL